MITINAALLERLGHPIALGCFLCRLGTARDEAALTAALEAGEAACRERLANTEPQAWPAVAAARAAYKALGKDPSRYRPAAEALLRRVMQDKPLYRIAPVVDCGNLLSLETGLSIGVYDLARLAPPLLLRRAEAGETYEGIGRGPLNLEALPVLCDNEGPFGSPTSDSSRTKVDAATGRALMVIYDLAGDTLDDPLLARAEALLERHAGPVEKRWIVRG